jgi:hypothetical protein
MKGPSAARSPPVRFAMRPVSDALRKVKMYLIPVSVSAGGWYGVSLYS